jgi:hypothetical protein
VGLEAAVQGFQLLAQIMMKIENPKSANTKFKRKTHLRLKLKQGSKSYTAKTGAQLNKTAVYWEYQLWLL